MTDHVFTIAEAGVNHNGSIELALQLIDIAAEAGADAVKFQTFQADRLTTAAAKQAAYQATNTGKSESQRDMLRQLELSAADHQILADHCRARGILFMSTAFDAESLRLLSQFDMPALKIPSGDINAGPLLLAATRLKKKMIVSTGMSSLADIEAALGLIAFGLTHDREPRNRTDLEAAYLSDAGQAALHEYVTLLHCVSQYPAPAEAVNLKAMDTMRAAFGLPVGYSDHTMGVEVALAAVARGANVIEKHFTLDRTLPGPDHAASLEPAQLKQLISGIRIIEQALGSAIKTPAATELANRPVVRRSIVAARPIAAGEIFSPDALTIKRPAGGLSPMDFWDLLGSPASRAFSTDEMIEK